MKIIFCYLATKFGWRVEMKFIGMIEKKKTKVYKW